MPSNVVTILTMPEEGGMVKGKAKSNGNSKGEGKGKGKKRK